MRQVQALLLQNRKGGMLILGVMACWALMMLGVFYWEIAHLQQVRSQLYAHAASSAAAGATRLDVRAYTRSRVTRLDPQNGWLEPRKVAKEWYDAYLEDMMNLGTGSYQVIGDTLAYTGGTFQCPAFGANGRINWAGINQSAVCVAPPRPGGDILNDGELVVRARVEVNSPLLKLLGQGRPVVEVEAHAKPSVRTFQF